MAAKHLRYLQSIKRIRFLRYIKSPAPNFLVALLCLVFCAFAQANPLLSEPTFLRVSTEQGLSQDTVNTLLIDQNGFLWIGTYDGLNRYDGYRVESIAGNNNELLNVPINSLFQDSKGNLWIGSEDRGVFQLNLQTGKNQKVVDFQSLSDPNFQQVNYQIFEDKQGDIWFVMEQMVVKYSYQTQSLTTVYQMNDKDIEAYDIFRWALLQDTTLFLATASKLLAVDSETGKAVNVDYLQQVAPSLDQLNSKFLYTDKHRLWIGTVEGLYSLPLTETLAYVHGKSALPLSTRHIEHRNIWRFAQASNGLFYIATDQGLYSYNQQTSQLQHLFLPTDSRESLASDVLLDILIDKKQNLWLGSEADGALYWSPKTTLFTNVFNARGGRDNKILSNNNVLSVYSDNNDELWIGTRNGLNVYNLNEGESQSFLSTSNEKSQYSSATISRIFKDKEQNLWLFAGASIVHFDAKAKRTIPLNVKNPTDQKLLNEGVYGMRLLPDGDILFFTVNSLYRYKPKTGEVRPLETPSAVNIAQAYALLPPLADRPNTTLLSLLGQLWELDNQTSQFTLLHSLKAKQHRANIYPDSAVLDEHGIVWIAYTGYGLVGIDNKTHEQKFFYDKDNLLPTNSIYGLQLDELGNIWMSSHAGILKFNPVTQYLQKFGVAQGLKNLEFNQFTNTTLLDGKMVYGSPKGLTIFAPKKLTESSSDTIQNQVRITNVELSTRLLSMPKTSLNGQHIELNHEDVGLKIYFSTLQYENQTSTRYGYRLSGASEIAFTETRVPEVLFPKLRPGEYTFAVVAFDSGTGVKGEEAFITIHVGYAPWLSPWAIASYVVVLSSFLLLLAWRKRKNDLALRAAHNEVVESKNKLTLALTASNSGIWEFDVTKQLFFTPRLTDELGHGNASEKVKFQEHLALIHPIDCGYYQNQWQRFFRGTDSELDVTFRMHAADGSWIWYRDLGSIVQSDAQGLPLVVTGTYTNVTDNLANQENSRLFAEAFKHTHDWVLIYDSQQLPIAANDAFKSVFNIPSDNALQASLAKIRDVQSPESIKFWDKLQHLKANKYWKGEDKIVFLDGSVCDVLIHINAIASSHDASRIEYYLLIVSDISEQKKAEEKLRRLANFDSLTGLPNRALLLDRVERGLEHANRHHQSMALFFIDLDRFKQVNDSLGHKAGDELLKIVSDRLINKLRKEDTVARLGGDEFVIMIEEVSSAEAISALVVEISALIDLPIVIMNQTVSVSSSIGIAMYPGDGATAEELLKNADIAMYHAKEQGRSNFQFFTERMDAIVKERMALENKLKAAHKQKRFQNYYQAIVNVDSGRVEGFEILMRWPTRNGMVPPDKFIPISEELGLIEYMTLDAFERAMPVLKKLNNQGFDGYLSVNLSARHFETQSSIDRIMFLLEAHEIPISSIRFEITESALMRDYEKALDYMMQIKQKGFLIALDDFGTGFSSLKYLKEFPIDVIKVDKSFVDDIGKNKNNEAIILTTLSMAKQLSMSCVAEGIEEQHQVDFFKQHGCYNLQGYFFSRPVPAEELEQVLEKRW
ncbi:EAL domain-containing protein [Flavobacterium sp. W21_SRS_FM6]|uniref:EAL domain-containing protein n=1 Tax=Flavobacterium sp. W21_SRS_FM6 TaxID=3240268 RepID=UPI003F9100BF